MTRRLLSIAVFVLLLASSAWVPGLDATPVDSTPAARYLSRGQHAPSIGTDRTRDSEDTVHWSMEECRKSGRRGHRRGQQQHGANHPAVGADAAVGVADSDQALADTAASAMRRYAFFDIFGWVTATSENGVVTLDGVVREPFQVRGYETMVARLSGVKTVVNNIEALPLSAFDDQIRGATIRAIDREGTLRPLMGGPRPAIHVVVANGRVRLEGVVRTELDKMLIEIGIRRGTVAFEIINNLQVESS